MQHARSTLQLHSCLLHQSGSSILCIPPTQLSIWASHTLSGLRPIYCHITSNRLCTRLLIQMRIHHTCQELRMHWHMQLGWGAPLLYVRSRAGCPLAVHDRIHDQQGRTRLIVCASERGPDLLWMPVEKIGKRGWLAWHSTGVPLQALSWSPYP